MGNKAPAEMTKSPAVPARWTDADYGLLTEIYELLCTSRMNAIYCERRLRELQLISLFMEILIALFATGSGAVANKTIATIFGANTWQYLIAITAIIAIIRPIYAPAKKIENLTRQQHKYGANYFALKKLAFVIRQGGIVKDENRRRFGEIFDRHAQASTDDETAPSGRHIKRARAQTASELPKESFWWPASASSTDASEQPELV